MIDQRAELEVTLAAGKAKLGPEQAALVALCRLLASGLDEKVTIQGCAAYLSALKDLGRVLGEDVKESVSGKLGELRSVHAGATVKSTRSRRSG